MLPELGKVAERLSEFGLVVAKMDATRNDINHPAIDVQFYPTVYFFYAGAPNEPVKFEGTRSAEALVDWAFDLSENRATKRNEKKKSKKGSKKDDQQQSLHAEL